MSEVPRFKVVKMLSEDGNRISYDPHGPEVVMASAFDRLKAEIAGLRTGYQAYERVNAELKAENERLERNRDMWKGQVERQAEELVSFRSELRVMDVLAEAMAEVKATSDGESAQPIADIVSGCLADIAALGKGEQS